VSARLLHVWDALRSSYWALPAVLAVLAIGASQGLLGLDRWLLQANVELLWLRETGGPGGARALLSTVAGSMITVAGVSFSTILVALSLTSSQFGPRLLRGFLRDRGNQAVLGTFIATFVYCLLVLRSVPIEADSEHIPQLSLMVAMGLALASVFVLIWFIHHAATSIQASSVIEVAGAELDEAIRQTFPSREGDESVWAGSDIEDLLPEDFEESAREVAAPASGYVQEVDTNTLVALAQERDWFVQLLHDRGGFVAEGQPLARVPVELDESTVEALAACVVLDVARASSRDVVRGVSQLTEVAVRALSPGINDPFTAIAALRRLGQSLALLGVRRLPTSTFYDSEGSLRLVMPSPAIPELLHLAFDPIRHYGCRDPLVPRVLLEVLTSVGTQASHPGLRRALFRHAEAVQRASLAAMDDELDRRRLVQEFENARRVLTGAS
jgi:uncharacterized membrane protein